jgi:TIR domain-containing protein
VTDIFISYASEDRERAGQLAQAFGAMGWSVWWDRRIIVGKAYDQPSSMSWRPQRAS